MNKKIGRIAALAALIGLGIDTVSATAFPGPDGAGYSGTSIPFNFRDISATGTPAFGGDVDDDVTSAIPLGFTFDFYGTGYTDAYISSNGFLTFSPGQSSGCCDGQPLPTLGNDPANLVAGWWTDLIHGPGLGGGNIYYQTLGVAGSREFVVEWLDNPYCCSASNPSNTFEIILHEATQGIELQYLSTTAEGHTRSAGIENDGGTIGLQLVNDSTTTFSQAGFCISQGGAGCSAATAVPEIDAAAGTGAIALLGGALALAGERRKRRRPDAVA